MAVHGTGPTNCDKGFNEYGAHIAAVRRRVRCWIPQLQETKAADNGFMASVMALRVLLEGAPHAGSMMIAKGEVETWQAAYFEWFARMKRRFPKSIDAEEVKTRALEEFTRLQELGVNLPKIIWEGEAYRDRIRSTEAPQPQRKAEPADPDWSPCKLVKYPEQLGDPAYGLTFDDFGAARKQLEASGLESDGYTWADIVRHLLAESSPAVLDALRFDAESSMLCVRSSDLEALGLVAQAIQQATSYPRALKRVLASLKGT
jgi:hypothetical protein